MKQHAIKIPVDGATPPAGCTVYQVRTVWLDDADQEIGGAVYFEVGDDTTGLPLATDFKMAEAIAKVEAILNPPDIPKERRMRQRAIKTPVDGAIPPAGCTVYQVKTVWIDNTDKEIDSAVYFEVGDDITSLPLAADLDMAVAITKAETILNQPEPDDVIKKEASSIVTRGRRSTI